MTRHTEYGIRRSLIVIGSITEVKQRRASIMTRHTEYGIRRSLIVIGSITEVKQRRARFIIGWVTAW